MDWDQILALITVCAVVPYVIEAAIAWMKRRNRSATGETNSFS
jgi:uncharacterized iron-regulated membrane protein